MTACDFKFQWYKMVSNFQHPISEIRFFIICRPHQYSATPSSTLKGKTIADVGVLYMDNTCYLLFRYTYIIQNARYTLFRSNVFVKHGRGIIYVPTLYTHTVDKHINFPSKSYLNLTPYMV